MTFLNIWHFFCYLLCEIISLSWNKSKHFLKITYMIAFFKIFFPRDHFPCDYYKCNKPNLTANPYIKHTCFVCLSSPNEPLSLHVNEMDYFLSTFLKSFTGKKVFACDYTVPVIPTPLPFMPCNVYTWNICLLT